jgi:hypothetical protein
MNESRNEFRGPRRFDAPCCHLMVVDKPMAGHNWMQAIARKLERDSTAEAQRPQRNAEVDSLKHG